MLVKGTTGDTVRTKSGNPFQQSYFLNEYEVKHITFLWHQQQLIDFCESISTDAFANQTIYVLITNEPITAITGHIINKVTVHTKL